MDDSSERVTTIDDGVEVERIIEDRPTATVVIHRLETLASTPSVVRVEESIPSEDRIETLEFHPNYRPNDWTIDEESVQFDVMVPSNERRSVVLGIDADGEEVLGRDEPVITTVDSETIDLDESAESVPLTRGGDSESPDSDRSSVLGLDTGTVANGGDSVDDAGVDAGDQDAVDAGTAEPDGTAGSVPDDAPNPDDPTGPDDPTEVGLGPATDGPERSSTAGTPGDTDDSADGDVALSEAEDGDIVDAPTDKPVVEEPVHASEIDETAETPDIGEAEDEVKTAETTGVADDSAGSQAGDESGDGAERMEPAESVGESQTDSASVPDVDTVTAADADAATAADTDSLVGHLLAEIEAGHASQGELDALRSELGVARADEVRFRHVQSRMDDFEAYADALEEIINSHGTASEFVDGIEREVTDLQDQISTVRTEVHGVDDALETADGEREELTDEVATIDDRVVELDETVTGLTDEVAELTDLFGTVDDRTATLEVDLREELDDVRDEVEAVHDDRNQEIERIETELETVREQLESDFETEFDSLREDVESLNEVRRSLLEAFGDGFEPAPDDESAVGEES